MCSIDFSDTPLIVLFVAALKHQFEMFWQCFTYRAAQCSATLNNLPAYSGVHPRLALLVCCWQGTQHKALDQAHP